MAVGAALAVKSIDDFARKSENGKFYITYYKISRTNPRKVYVGRCSGYGDPNTILKRYDATHRMNGDFGDAIMDQSITGTALTNLPQPGMGIGTAIGCYSAIRGREQQLMDNFSMRGFELGNTYRGVSKLNQFGKVYYAASCLAFGIYAPYTGF